jgi:hypothetical protein
MWMGPAARLGERGFGEGVAEGGDGLGEGLEAVAGSRAGEVEGVPVGVEVSFEGGGFAATEAERCGCQLEAWRVGGW